MSLSRSSWLASAMFVVAACSSTPGTDAGTKDMSVADLSVVHLRTLTEASCPASLSAMYSRCYVDYVPTDFF